MNPEISVLLVDDHPVFRKGLRMMLEEDEGISVAGEAGDGEEAIGKATELTPDVVVMDISMPGMDGIEATRRIVAELPGVKVLPLSIHSGKRFVENMLRAGAAGYVLKERAPEELVAAIRSRPTSSRPPKPRLPAQPSLPRFHPSRGRHHSPLDRTSSIPKSPSEPPSPGDFP